MKTSANEQRQTTGNEARRERIIVKKLSRRFIPNLGTLIILGLFLWAQAVGAFPFNGMSTQSTSLPALINYQGRLNDAGGNPVPDGNYVMQFALYDAATGGNQIWKEVRMGGDAVVVSNGLFNVMLGEVTPLPTPFPAGGLWLGVTVGSDAEMTPRERLGSVPFALVADVPAGSITTAKLADNAVTSAKIVPDAVGSAAIASDAVSSSELADDAVSTAKIQSEAVTETKLADNAVTTAKIAADAVGSTEIASGAVSSGELADNAVSTSKIQSGAVTETKLADNAVTTAKIAADAVGSSEIASGAVGSGELGDSAVSTAKIQNGAVTSAKIAADAVGSSELADNAVSTAKIQSGAVTSAKLVDNAVTSAKIAADAVGSPEVAAGAVSSSELADNAVSTAKIQNGAVTTAKLNVDNGLGVSGDLTVSGNVGIGTTTESGHILDVSAGSGEFGMNVTSSDPIQFQGLSIRNTARTANTNANLNFRFDSGASISTSSVRGVNVGGDADFRNELEFSVMNAAGSEVKAMRIDSTGNVGIGTMDPTERLHVDGNILASGSKSAVVNSAHHGRRKLYAAESPEVRFFDEGLARLKDGVAQVMLDPVFLETIEGQHLVHVTPYGDAILYVAEVGTDYFVVKARDGDSNVAFAWRLSAHRKGYNGVRLEEVR